MVRACKEGNPRRLVWRCLPPLKGRKGQGKGRVSSSRGKGKNGAPCKHGVSKGSGKCRTPSQGRRHKMMKSVLKTNPKIALRAAKAARRARRAERNSGEVSFKGSSANQG